MDFGGRRQKPCWDVREGPDSIVSRKDLLEDVSGLDVVLEMGVSKSFDGRAEIGFFDGFETDELVAAGSVDGVEGQLGLNFFLLGDF